MTRQFIVRVVSIGALIVLLDLWLVCGIERVGNVVVFYLWLLCFVQGVGALLIASDADKPRIQPAPRELRGFVSALHYATAIALVWIGYVVLPAALILTTALFSAALDKRRTPATEAQS